MEKIPTLFRKRALTPAVRLFDSEAFNRRKLQKLFRGNMDSDTVYSEAEITYEIELVLRTIGEWHATPAPADRDSDVQAGKRRARTLFWAESFDLDSETLATFKDFGESVDMPLSLQDLTAKRDRDLATKTRRKVNKARRAVEKLCADVLTTVAATVDVDDTDQTINYTIHEETAAVSWAVATTEIIIEFARWIAEYIDRAGAAPTHIIISHHFWDRYIVGNDDFRAFDIRNLVMSTIERLMRALGRSDMLTTEWIEITDRYVHPDTKVMTQIWPTNRMTFLNLDEEEGPVLELATTRTLDNDLQGGLFASSLMHEEHPKRLEVTVSNNNIPIIRDYTKVTTYLLEP